MAGPTDHSELGASGAKRWMTCSGSFQLARAVTQAAARSSTSIHAAKGTIAHGIAERVLAGELRSASEAVDEHHVLSGWDVIVDNDMAEAVRVYVHEVRARTNEYCVVRHEERVTLEYWWIARGLTPPKVQLFGTADTWIYDPIHRRLTIIDFKHGSGVYVSVTDNPQLLYYAAGVLAGFSKIMAWQVIEIVIVVVQPRVQGKAPVRTETITVVDLLLWIDTQLIPAVERVFEPDPGLVTGEHCRFCNAWATCPARQAEKTAQAKNDFADASLDQEM